MLQNKLFGVEEKLRGPEKRIKTLPIKIVKNRVESKIVAEIDLYQMTLEDLMSPSVREIALYFNFDLF